MDVNVRKRRIPQRMFSLFLKPASITSQFPFSSTKEGGVLLVLPLLFSRLLSNENMKWSCGYYKLSFGQFFHIK